MYIFSFYKSKHLYANFIKIDKRVLTLGEMKSDVFYYGFACYRIGCWIGFYGGRLVEKKSGKYFNNAYLMFIFLLAIVMKPERFASLSDCTCS